MSSAPNLRTGFKAVDVFAWFLLLAGTGAMALVMLLGSPLEVSDHDCVRLWNATAAPPEGVPPQETPIRLVAEDEQDLGYGLCAVLWQGDDGRCYSLNTAVWNDTDTWQASPVRACQDFADGRAVQLDGGDLLLVVE